MLPSAEFQILLALADGHKHGRGIKLDVSSRTDGRIDMGPGTLYGAIKRLRRRGWIEEVTRTVPDVHDQRLRHYALTRDGRAAAEQEAARLTTLVRIAQAKRLIG
jgi:DNA-binding PadR family transcriptional regulator